ncbi:hypothetical protein HDR61_00560 [bacterium]|nr:hypothetical protein [bacterium]
MKRLIAVLSGLLVLPAFAEVAPIYYEDVIEYADVDAVDAESTEDIQDNVVMPAAQTAAKSPTARTNTTRNASRAVATGGATVAPTRNVTTRGVSGRSAGTTARTTTNVNAASRSTAARATVSRASNSAGAMPVTPRRASTGAATAARAATTSSIVQTDTVSTPLYTGRVGVRSNVTSRVPTIRMAGSAATVAETSVSATSTATDMDELAQLTDFCKAQYMSCMDNFCNVLDDNQGRCSCSANLKNYATTEAALKQATEDLQDVAQKIQYIGLSGDDIETLFSQTEAELTLQNKTDNTQLKNDLDKIKNLIVDVKSGNAVSSDSGLSFDLSGLLDFSISSTGFDLSNLFGVTSNTSSISNQRGEQLFKTATARCKASVLNSCTAQGVDASLITNAYDLEIDKQCIAYERSLTEANDQMASTVRNAKSVLQKARLMVAQQKNQYDLRGCVNALDSCMQDDFVCGSDYENCLDPTGKYIVNGAVVAGSTPGVAGVSADSGEISTGLYQVWNYKAEDSNPWTDGTVAAYIANSVSTTEPKQNTSNMIEYLQAKIGYVKDGKNFGMCSSVLNKCQDLTYTTGSGANKSFTYGNSVIKEYLQRTLVQIKAKQDQVLSDYADSCISDVASCLSQNNYNFSGSYYNTSNSNTPSDVAIKACNAVITTCMSVTGYEGTEQKKWLDMSIGTQYIMTQERCDKITNAAWDSSNNQCKLTIDGNSFIWRDNLRAFQGASAVTKAKCDTITGAEWNTGTSCTINP